MSHRCFKPSFVEIGLLVLEKKIFERFFERFLPYMGLALIGQVVSQEQMFEYYGDIHVYCPGVGAYEPLWSIFCQNH